MKKTDIFRLSIILLVVVLFPFSSCDERDKPASGFTEEDTFIPYNAEVADFIYPVYIHFTDQGVTLSGSGLSLIQYTTEVAHPGRLTITTNNKYLTYIVSGSTNDGQLKFFSDYKFALYLDDTRITSTDGPAINNQCKKSCFIVLPEGSHSLLKDCDIYTQTTTSEGDEEKNRGCLYSRGQVIMVGSGQLDVDCTGTVWYDAEEQDSVYVHAVNIGDYFICHTDVTLNITARHGNGLHVKDSIIHISQGTFAIDAGKCGMYGKEANILIEGGDIKILAHTDDAIKDSLGITIRGGNLEASSLLGYGLRSKGGNIDIHGGLIRGCSYDRYLRTKLGVTNLFGGTLLSAGGRKSKWEGAAGQYVYSVEQEKTLKTGNTLSAINQGETITTLVAPMTIAYPYVSFSSPSVMDDSGLVISME